MLFDPNTGTAYTNDKNDIIAGTDGSIHQKIADNMYLNMTTGQIAPITKIGNTMIDMQTGQMLFKL